MLEKSAHACVNIYLNKLLKCLWAVVSQETATAVYTIHTSMVIFLKALLKL